MSKTNVPAGTATGTMPLDQLRQLRPATIVVVFVVCLIVLEWGTFLADYSPLGITPWHPAVGLAFAVVLLLGFRYAILLPVASLLADLVVRHMPLPMWIEVAETLLTSGAYIAALWVLTADKMRFDPSLGSMRDLLLLVGIAVIAAGTVAVTYVSVLHWSGLLPLGELLSAILRYWVGDVIGILVVTPFLLILATRGRFPRLTLETVLQGLSIVAAISIVLGAGPAYQQQLFYILFLPIVWIAVRTGLSGVVVGLVAMQIGLMIALHVGFGGPIDVPAFQAVMLVLTFSALAIGILISERERAERQLRQQEVAVARVGRIASLGSVTASIAHEINQPLTAIGNYARVSLRSLQASPPALDAARAAAEKAVAQVDRAAGVMRGLRDLLHSGRADLAPEPVTRMVAEAVELLAPEMANCSAQARVDVPRGLPLVMADRLQIEQVIINLVRNGLDAMGGLPVSERRIWIGAARRIDGDVEVKVTDRGTGFPAGFDIDLATPGRSDKPDGLGMGLVLCRSILEAHGSSLVIGRTGQETTVSFRLAAARGGDDDGPA